jgi:hypothetical protein
MLVQQYNRTTDRQNNRTTEQQNDERQIDRMTEQTTERQQSGCTAGSLGGQWVDGGGQFGFSFGVLVRLTFFEHKAADTDPLFCLFFATHTQL